MPLAVRTPTPAPERPIRVMVVDDAVVFRGLVSRWLSEEPDIEIVGSHRNGYEALDNFLRVDPDVVVLDIEMPGIDGLETLPLLLEKKPDVTVIISSTVTRRNAEVGIRALSLGAKDYLSKPESNREMTMSLEFRRDLVQKIRELGRRGIRKLLRAQMPEAAQERAKPAADFKLRPFSAFPPRVVVVGASTGGPQALQILMRGLDPVLRRLPVLVTQHMPATFTTIFAEHLARATARPAHEGLHGETLAAGTLYVAPGGRHMQIERKAEQVKVVIDDGPPVNFCRPSVDPLFSSAASIFGAGTVAVILTGMGADGAVGAARIAAAGGTVIAQDEATSVVWGMPGAAAEAGVCSAVLPLESIAAKVVELVGGGPA
jgi:two-component system, chemotaxis family, protein-glutamate methylesterase/glutaminase